ncbi:rab-GTPase-TBC domain-containing protein [Powellomyces hirtus]|nr:rab-GTPase-TBC domain-containing protein [Powellomyces hirtus]
MSFSSRDRPAKLHIPPPTPDTTPLPSPPRSTYRRENAAAKGDGDEQETQTAPPRAVTSEATTAEAELPSYDQYGFNRTTTYTSLHDQKLFDSCYRAVCDKRTLKWKEWLVKHNNTGMSPTGSGRNLDDLMMPPRSEKAKRYMRKGVPHHLRKRVWFHYSGAEACLQDQLGLFTLLICREEQDIRAGYTSKTNEIIQHITVIDRDIYRTFPDNIKFRPRQSTIPSTQFARPESRVSVHSSSDSSTGAGSASSSELDIGDSRTYSNVDDEQSQAPPKSAHPSIHFEQNPYLLSLRRILVAFAYYSWYHPDPDRVALRHCKYPIGYCQSLNFIVAFLLLVFADDDFDYECGGEQARLSVEERVFWMLVVVVEDLLPDEMFGSTLEGARASQEVLWTYLIRKNGTKYGLEKMEKWLEAQDPTAADNAIPSSVLRKALYPKRRKPVKSPSMPTDSFSSSSNSTSSASAPLSLITTQWFMTVFVTTLPPHALLRLWDMFIYQGEKVLFRFALTMFAMHQSSITRLSLADLSAWRYIKTLPHTCYDVAACVEMFRGKHPHLHAHHHHQHQQQHQHNHNTTTLTKPALAFFNRQKHDEQGASPITPTDEYYDLQWEAHAGLRKGVGTVSRELLAQHRAAVLKELRS